MLITQWPRDISRRTGGSAEIHCYQNDTDYQYLYWYKQLGQKLQLIVYVVGSPTFEEEFKSGFQAVTVTQKHWSLNISNIQQKDEAVYLCAASQHGAAADRRSVTKTPFIVLTPDSLSQ